MLGGVLMLACLLWPERSGPREIGIHHTGAELEPAKGDSGVKAIVVCRVVRRRRRRRRRRCETGH